MSESCDLLILTASFGSGHLSVTDTISKCIQELNPEIKIQTADLYQILHPTSYQKIYKNYAQMVKWVPHLYNSYYFLKERIGWLRKMDTLSGKNLQKLTQAINKTQPKVVLSTFPICTGYMSHYKEKTGSPVPLLTCVTDIVASREWIYPNNDCYFVAEKSIKDEMIRKGVDRNNIVVTGIPVRKEFLQTVDPDQTRKMMELPLEKDIILMMGGGLGLLPMNSRFYRWMDCLQNIHVVVLTAGNKKLNNKLQNMGLRNFTLLEYTKKVPEYMKVSRYLIGKAGGITLYEAVASQLPLIAYRPVLGQEIINSRFLKNHHMGVIIKNLRDLKKQFPHLQENEGEREQLVGQLKILHDQINVPLLAQTILKVLRR